MKGKTTGQHPTKPDSRSLKELWRHIFPVLPFLDPNSLGGENWIKNAKLTESNEGSLKIPQISSTPGVFICPTSFVKSVQGQMTPLPSPE